MSDVICEIGVPVNCFFIYTRIEAMTVRVSKDQFYEFINDLSCHLTIRKEVFHGIVSFFVDPDPFVSFEVGFAALEEDLAEGGSPPVLSQS